ncbi:MAG: cupin [Verrucomicrobia bacterium]|nr:cupin [Verrucomicrobiota bacterium]
MANMVKKSFDAPDEIRSFEKSKIEVVKLGDAEALRVTNQPGWRWSECVKPIVGTDSCHVSHLIHVLSGRIKVRMDDGSEARKIPVAPLANGPAQSLEFFRSVSG